MARKSIDALGPIQRTIIEIVWEHGEVTVHQVLERLSRGRTLAYTTVLSTMQKLEKAGWLTHREEGRAYVYRATRSREEEGKNTLRKLIARVFGGKPLVLFQHLLEDDELTAKDLAALRKMIDQRRKERPDA
jgi:predicted transcriptional regulator